MGTSRKFSRPAGLPVPWPSTAICAVVVVLNPVWTVAARAPEEITDPGARHTPQAVVTSADVVALGKTKFEAVCGTCHGAGARGGRNGAPDLLTSSLALGDPRQFREFVTHGSAERGMPPFPLEDPVLVGIQAHIKALASGVSRRGRLEAVVVGNADRGRKYFEGSRHCVECHSAVGDLKGIGSRLPVRVIQGRLLLPRGNGVHPGLIQLGVHIPGVTDEVPVRDSPITVTVRQPAGPAINGRLLSISDFDVALRDAEGRYRSYTRHGDVPEVTVHDPAQAHVDVLGQMTDDVMHDLTAYLVTLR